VDVYQNHPSFRALRDANLLQGKCGRCEFRHVCGGSRARSFAVSGDMSAAEPDCDYLPAALSDTMAGNRLA
jgi:radical SAM protein with 4Fe4S-binding SPASM domain